MSVDFAALRAAVRQGAERAFTQVRQSHPDEQFYAFALYTDDGAMTVEPAANSEEALQRKLSGAGTADPVQASYYRWAISEWAYEAEGGEHLQEAYDLLNISNRYGDEEEDAADEEDETEDSDELPDDFEEDERFSAFKAELIRTMTEALRELDASGFFGSGAERERVTLFVSITDADDGEEIENESARQLNPDVVYQRFRSR